MLTGKLVDSVGCFLLWKALLMFLIEGKEKKKINEAGEHFLVLSMSGGSDEKFSTSPLCFQVLAGVLFAFLLKNPAEPFEMYLLCYL